MQLLALAHANPKTQPSSTSMLGLTPSQPCHARRDQHGHLVDHWAVGALSLVLTAVGAMALPALIIFPGHIWRYAGWSEAATKYEVPAVDSANPALAPMMVSAPGCLLLLHLIGYRAFVVALRASKQSGAEPRVISRGATGWPEHQLNLPPGTQVKHSCWCLEFIAGSQSGGACELRAGADLKSGSSAPQMSRICIQARMPSKASARP